MEVRGVFIVGGCSRELETLRDAWAILPEILLSTEGTDAPMVVPSGSQLGDEDLRARLDGARVVIAGCGTEPGLARRLAGMTRTPVLAVPLPPADPPDPDEGLECLLEVCPREGDPSYAVLAVGSAGARNACLLTVAILAGDDPELAAVLDRFRSRQAATVMESRVALHEDPPSAPLSP